ncbi:nucleoside/nucleotide kinase family protein [Nocardia bovistercoris]|uniref:Uridine kinase n=1 Tax=Nocardia bovistercoris TaxID=2785916 RepID=A0A931I6W1_9NOCA|nr:hypothetical protein [Nocardia bovistercoris]MBH0774988.1 hypothetical protein [Nocardia bovistercoris]
MPDFVAITPQRLVASIADDLDARAGHRLIAVDGADAAAPVALAELLAAEVRERGGAAEVISTHDFVRPASLRLEFGRTDEMSYRDTWFDFPALRREVLDALRTHDRWLPALWDERHDRSARTPVRTAHPRTVLVVAGPMLLGRGLDFDVTVRLDMSESALRRRTTEDELWTIAPLLAFAHEHPETPTYHLRWDHPDRPALLVSER